MLSLLLAATGVSAHFGAPHQTNSKPPPERCHNGVPRNIIAGTYNETIVTFTFTPPSKLAITKTTSTESGGWNDTAPSWIQPSAVLAGKAYVCDEGQLGQAIEFDTSSITPISFGSTEGFGPAYLGTSADGKWIYGPNYGDGNWLGLPIDPATGEFLPNDQPLIQFEGHGPTQYQTSPHPHMSLEHPTSKHVFVPDLGTDQIHEIALSADGIWTLIQNITVSPPGSGPRHMRFNPDGTVAYLLAELGNALHIYTVDSPADGPATFTEVAVHNVLPPGATPIEGQPLAAGEILLTKDGSGVYCSNRDDANPEGDAIAIFNLVPPFGTNAVGPTWVRSGGSHIRGMELSPAEDYLIAGNMLSKSVAMFARDATTNGLTRTTLYQTNYQTTTFLWL